VNILNLPGWTVLQLDERDGEYRVLSGRNLYGVGLDSIAEIIDNALDAYIGVPFSTDEGDGDEVISDLTSNQ
jgi:hypothetical protein